MKMLLSSSAATVVEYLSTQNLNDKPIAYITTASYGKKLDGSRSDRAYIHRCIDKMNKNNIGFDEILLEDLVGKDPYEVLKKYDYVYVSGGNTFYLLSVARQVGFDKAITKLINEGLTYLGSSAGSYITCPTIEMATWSPNDRFDRHGIDGLTGLNLVPFLVKAHYMEEKKPHILKGMKESNFETLVLTDDQAILYEDGNVSYFGNQEKVELSS